MAAPSGNPLTHSFIQNQIPAYNTHQKGRGLQVLFFLTLEASLSGGHGPSGLTQG